MKIKPDYQKKPICYFCNQNLAIEDAALTDTKYAVTKSQTIPISVRYFSLEVEVPRCKECEKKHSKAGIPHIIAFFVVFILLGWFFLTKGTGGWTDTWYTICFGVFVDAFLSFFISYFIATPFRLLVNTFFKGCKDAGDTDNYKPIEKLHKCGFKDNKPDPMMSQGDEIDEREYKNTINSIIREDNCIITK